MTLLSLTLVSKSFGGVRALKDVSLELEQGETLGLMGANGAGKTTLFGLIAGHDRPTVGTIRLDGRRIDRLTPDRICRLGIARTFQIVRPFRGLSVRDNVLTAVLFGRDRVLSHERALARADTVLAELELTDQAGAPAAALTLSGQKRLEVARALATGPRILLLDEVMAGLTPAEVARMMERLRELKNRYALTIVIIEHVMRALMELSSRVVVLHHGEMIGEGTPAQIARDERVARTYFGAAT